MLTSIIVAVSLLTSHASASHQIAVSNDKDWTPIHDLLCESVTGQVISGSFRLGGKINANQFGDFLTRELTAYVAINKTGFFEPVIPTTTAGNVDWVKAKLLTVTGFEGKPCDYKDEGSRISFELTAPDEFVIPTDGSLIVAIFLKSTTHEVHHDDDIADTPHNNDLMERSMVAGTYPPSTDSVQVTAILLNELKTVSVSEARRAEINGQLVRLKEATESVKRNPLETVKRYRQRIYAAAAAGASDTVIPIDLFRPWAGPSLVTMDTEWFWTNKPAAWPYNVLYHTDETALAAFLGAGAAWTNSFPPGQTHDTRKKHKREHWITFDLDIVGPPARKITHLFVYNEGGSTTCDKSSTPVSVYEWSGVIREVPSP